MIRRITIQTPTIIDVEYVCDTCLRTDWKKKIDLEKAVNIDIACVCKYCLTKLSKGDTIEVG